MNKYTFDSARFYCSVDSALKLGWAQAEVALAGRSNVGKSSLVNALCDGHPLARVSKTPGKTRTINVFSLREGKWLVDLPGYGFARVSKKEHDSWKPMIEGYFSSRASLKAIFMIVDADIGPTVLDRQMLAWLKSTQMPYWLVVNKIDRITQVRLAEQRQGLAAALGVNAAHIIWASAKKGDGIRELFAAISGFLK